MSFLGAIAQPGTISPEQQAAIATELAKVQASIAARPPAAFSPFARPATLPALSQGVAEAFSELALRASNPDAWRAQRTGAPVGTAREALAAEEQKAEEQGFRLVQAPDGARAGAPPPLPGGQRFWLPYESYQQYIVVPGRSDADTARVAETLARGAGVTDYPPGEPLVPHDYVTYAGRRWVLVGPRSTAPADMPLLGPPALVARAIGRIAEGGGTPVAAFVGRSAAQVRSEHTWRVASVLALGVALWWVMR